MIEAFWVLVTALDFLAPAIAVWFLVLRRGEDFVSSALAAGGASAFLVPTSVFVLNRLFGYPIDRLSLTAVAVAIVGASVVWRWGLAGRLERYWPTFVRFGRLVGGEFRDKHPAHQFLADETLDGDNRVA